MNKRFKNITEDTVLGPYPFAGFATIFTKGEFGGAKITIKASDDIEDLSANFLTLEEGEITGPKVINLQLAKCFVIFEVEDATAPTDITLTVTGWST